MVESENYCPNCTPTLTHINTHDTLQEHQHKMKQAETINPLDPVDRNNSGKEGISYVDIYPGA